MPIQNWSYKTNPASVRHVGLPLRISSRPSPWMVTTTSTFRLWMRKVTLRASLRDRLRRT